MNKFPLDNRAGGQAEAAGLEQATGATTSPELSLRAACRIVVVNWNSGPRLRTCVQSIPEPFEVVVVDNGSGDDSVALLSRAEPTRSEPGEGGPEHGPGTEEGISFQSEAAGEWKSRRERLEAILRAGARRTVWLIRNRGNAGFAAAANAGAAGCSREFLLFLNPDVSFSWDGSADAMLSLLQLRPKAAAATGRLDTAAAVGGRARCSGRSSLIRPLPTLASALADVLFLDELWAPAVADRGEGDLGVRKIEQAPGACLLIRREIFEWLGGFDPAFYPAWFEDVDLCRRLRDSRYEIFYQPQSVFYHEGGYSVGQLGRAEFHRLFYGNMIRYFRKHHGAAPAALLQLVVPLGNALRRLWAWARKA